LTHFHKHFAPVCTASFIYLFIYYFCGMNHLRNVSLTHAQHALFVSLSLAIFIDDLNSSGPPIVSSYVHCSSLNFSTLDRVQSGGSKPDHVRSDQMASDGPSGEPGNCCRCRLSDRPTSNGSFPPQVHFP